MNLSSLSLNRPVLAIVLNIIIVIFGVIGYNFLGVRKYPSVDPPIISVSTSYTGANPEIIESQITEPLEKAINGVAGIKTITSQSTQGSSRITAEFELGTDLNAAANDIRSKVNQAVRQLPDDLEGPPVVRKSDASAGSIIAVTVKSDTRNLLELTDFATNVLQERLQTIPGVSSVRIWGEKKYTMRLWINPDKLAAFDLTPLDVYNALKEQNVELPSGKITGKNTELTIRTFGRLSEEHEFNNIIIKNVNGTDVRFKDIGYAELGPENEESILRGFGKPMVACAIVPLPGANYVNISNEFYERLERIKKVVPRDITLSVGMDNTRYIKKSIKEVEHTLLIAFILVILIIYLFFRDALMALRPLIDIPVCLIGAFFIMYVAGFSINILTLLAIVLATGLVVDDGIVVTENIFRKMELGLSKKEAAREGAKEIYFAVISTSITLAVVFLPIIFLPGFVGRLFREFGVVIAGAVLISAFVSLSLTPVLNVYLSKKNPTKKSWFYRKTEPYFQALVNGYRRSLTNFMRRRWLAFVMIGVSALFIFLLWKVLPSELAPKEDQSVFRIFSQAPEGATFQYMDNFILNLSQLIEDSVPEAKVLLSVTSPGWFGSGSPNTGYTRVVLVPADQRKRSQQAIVDQINRNLNHLPAAKAYVIQPQTISGGGGSQVNLPVQFVIQNNNFEKIRTYLPKFVSAVDSNPVFQRIRVNLKFNKPEIYVTINREKAATLGVSVLDVATTLQLALSGRRFGYFTMHGKQYQVIGQVKRKDRSKPLDLKTIYVRNEMGESIQLANLVTLEVKSNPPQIYHYNRYKSATITAGLAPGVSLGKGIDEMQAIADRVLDKTFFTALSGQSLDYRESTGNATFALIFALIFVFLVLAAQFESFIDPFIIMFTVPLAIAGALLSLWIFGQSINIFSQIGIIMLVGLVTKNGILIVEFANQLKDKGYSSLKATIEAATLRMRPILMTSLATALGALPIALALGAGAESRIPLGIVIVGGIAFSLILTLYVVPAMYSYMSMRKVKANQKNG